MAHIVTYGKKQGCSYSRIDEIPEIPDLIEIQRKSYRWFLEHGAKETFNDLFSDPRQVTVILGIRTTPEEHQRRCTDAKKDATPRRSLINKETEKSRRPVFSWATFP